LSQGEELAAVARLDGETPESIAIHGSLDGASFEKVIPVRDIAPNAGYLPRTWAKLEIDRLLAEEKPDHKARIIELSKAMYVMTPYTSLLVLENEAMYREFHVDRGRKDHWALYSCPDKIPTVFIPDPNMPRSWNAPEFVERKPHENVVWQTIVQRAPLHYVTGPEPGSAEEILEAFQMLLERPNNANIFSRLDSQAQLEARMRMAAQSRTSGGSMPIGEVSGVPPQLPVGLMDGSVRDVTPFFHTPWSDVLNGGETVRFAESDAKRPLGLMVDDLEEFGVDVFGRKFTKERKIDKAADLISDRQRLFQFGLSQLIYDAKESSPIGGGLYGWNLSSNAPVQAWVADRFEDKYGDVTNLEYKERLRGSRALERLGRNNFNNWSVGVRYEVPVSPHNGRLDLRRFARYNVNGIGTPLGEIDTTVEDLTLPALLTPRPDPAARVISDDLGTFVGGGLKSDDAIQAFALDPEVLLQRRGPRYYTRPSFSREERIFTDLAAYAPGMSSSRADILAVLEAEAAPRSGQRKGTVDSAARKRIESACTDSWHGISCKDEMGKDFVFYHDGLGRYSYQRQLALGLVERVVCDGATILHLYPELGIGARRAVSRFHRAELCGLLPQVLLPTDDLADGADVKLIDADTVALVPLPRVDGTVRKAWLEIHLAFAGNELAERRLVLMPEKKVLLREIYRDNGIVVMSAPGKEAPTGAPTDPTSSTSTSPPPKTNPEKKPPVVMAASPPDLKPDVSSLVILPLPLRSREVIYRKVGLDPNIGLFVGENPCFEYLAPELALELLACEFAAGDGPKVENVWQYCFAERGDRRPGFFTLMVSSGWGPHWGSAFRKALDEDRSAGPYASLIRYLKLAFEPATLYAQRQTGILSGDQPTNDFLGSLLTFRTLSTRWGDAGGGVFAPRDSERDRALAFARQHAGDVWGWSTMCLLADRAMPPERREAIAGVWGLISQKSALNYHARYEQARNLSLAPGQSAQAREIFRKLFKEVLAYGIVPPIDAGFRAAFAVSDDAAEWQKLMTDSARACIGAKHRPLAVRLAWQCRQLGDQALADEMLAMALKEPTTEVERIVTTLTAIEYLWAVDSIDYADRLTTELLQVAELQRQPVMWRLASKIAEKRGNAMRQFECLEKALDLEFVRMPEVFSIEPIRRDYGALLAHYQWLADASRNLKVAVPADLLARAVKAADRWRALDPEAGNCCNLAAKILRTVGGPEAESLAWDFLTTPLALRPNESAPWLGLAATASQEGDLPLADRCYEAAFAAEPTNAQILWDWSRLLERRGDFARSREVLGRLVRGDWQPRFENLRRQARQIVEGT